MNTRLLALPAALLLTTLACGDASDAPVDAEARIAAVQKKVEEAIAEGQKPEGDEATKAEASADAKATPADLLDPSKWTLTAPDTYTVKLATTEGDILLDVTREWAPKGADRFYNLVQAGYFVDVAFFRVINGFMAQGGLHGDPAVNAAWRNARIEDDPKGQTNARGTLSFATAGPNTRTTQFFINFVDNGRLDGMGFTPIGKVRDMAVVDKLYNGYGEGAPMGRGPSQGRITQEGNAYLKADFPELDYILSAEIVE